MCQPFTVNFEVRDYELDLQGIVNNSVYMNYLEHARHTFLTERGLDFARLHEKNIDLVVIRVEMDYKRSLRSGDRFMVSVAVRRTDNVRLLFEQEITNAAGQLILKAKVYGVCLYNMKPVNPEKYLPLNTLLT